MIGRPPKDGAARQSLPVFELRAQPAEAFWVGARNPAQSTAEKFVFRVASQTEAADFLIELAEFGGVLPPFGQAFGQGGALTAVDANAMELGNGRPLDVTLGIK